EGGGRYGPLRATPVGQGGAGGAGAQRAVTPTRRLKGEGDEARRLVRRCGATREGLGGVPRSQAAPQGDPRLRKARGARTRRVQGDAEDRGRGREGHLRGQGASRGQKAARVVPPRGR